MKYRFLKKRMLSLSLLFVVSISFSQQTIIDATAITTYNSALELYNTKAYAAAQKTFSEVHKKALIGSNLKSDASFYEAMCAIKLKHPDADKKVLSYVKENPNSTKKNTIFFNIGSYYFANKKASYALKWFLKINLEELSNEDQKALNFKMGYCFLVTNNFTTAKPYFLPLLNDAKFGNDARYYYGFISYKLEDYGIAESTLKEIADNDSYKAEISYYLLDISFKSGKFERCIKVGLELFATIDKKMKPEVSKIIGESYFNLKKYAESIPYLKGYKSRRIRWNNTDFYQLGYAYYKQNDFENAINNFNKIIDQKNAVSQNAYYHLGECYMNLEKKAPALNAFKSASEMDFDLQIKEDAALNYAKLSYEEGNPFEPVSEVLRAFLNVYPNSEAYQEINALVVSSFLNEQDYKGALQFLSEEKSEENVAFRFEISLYRAIQLFNKNKYKEALPYFVEGKKSEHKEISQKAAYWEAETCYTLENYKKAFTKFNNLKAILNANNQSDFPLIDYNIGYSYFQLKEYDKAGKAFLEFLKKEALPDKLKYDALIRLGDSYFATTNYREAILSYQKAANNSDLSADYATYQIGMSYGFIGNNEAKVTTLKKVINNYPISNLKDDALYQIGNTYATLKGYKNAHLAYDRLLKKHPKSIFVSRVLLRQGLLYFNDNANQKAILKYKEVTARFPNSPDAKEAVSNARNVYIDDGNLEGYVNWTATLKFIKITDSELDNTAFAIAEKNYLASENTKKTISNLKKYLKKFENGAHHLKANYYLAETLFKTKEFEKSTLYYETILNQKPSEFTEESLNKVSQIYLKQGNFKKAVTYLERLEEEAYAKENVLFAQSNLMKGYYEEEAYDLAITYAEKVLQRVKIDNLVANDAKTIIARASIKTKDFRTAEDYYAEIEKTANGELKAETLYYNAYFKNKEKEYEASNAVVQKLIAKYAAYKYWAVKSYVIMGKNYYGLNDVYQATFVLENVIKNFTKFETIVKEAQLELDTIKTNEAKTNNSVIPEKKNE